MINMAWAVSAGLMLSAGATGLMGAPPTAEQLLVKRPLKDALDESRAKGRLLLVEIAGNADRQKKALADYQAAPIRRWVDRYAMAVLLTDLDTIRTLTESELNPGPDADPLVFRDGQWVRMFGTGAPPKKSRVAGPGRPGEAFLGLGFKLDWTSRGKDDTLSPTPVERPEEPARFIHGVSDEGAVGVTDPTAPGLEPLLARLREAQSLLASDKPEDLKRAAGLYTWLWERGDAWDDRFTFARWLTVTPDIAALIAKHPPAKGRFAEVRRAMMERLDLRDHAALFDLLMLSRAIGDHEENLAFLDAALNDPDASLIMPVGERVAWEFILPACHWQPSGGAEPVDRLKRQDAKARRMMNGLDERAAAIARRVHAMTRTLELGRAYATALARGNDAPASALLKEAKDERAAMVIAALANGQARADQAEALADHRGAEDVAAEVKRAAKPKK